jgi:CRISPR-associated Csx10 family RAMP protein
MTSNTTGLDKTSMVRIQLRLKALSPVAFSARRGTSNFVDTLDYVPGSALRGATAARYLREIGEASDPRFQAVFVKEEASFGNLYPVRYSLRSSVIPSTARSCKAFEGFRSTSDDKHGVFDTLMPAASAVLFQDFFELDKIADCSQCGQPTHRFSGFYEEPLVTSGNENRTESRIYSRVDLYKRHLTHVGINRTSQSAEPGFLYAQQIISECWHDKTMSEFKPQVFSGELLVSDAQAEYLQDTLIERGTTLRLGESRSRGLGRMEVESIAQAESETAITIRERMLEFNKRFADRARRSSGVDHITLTLQSDGRAFSPVCEVRWQHDSNLFHTVCTGSITQPPAPLTSQTRELLAGDFDHHDGSYFLWGEWSDKEPRWLEASIPHIFDYPVPQGNGKWRIKLLTKEYISRTTGDTEFYRFADVTDPLPKDKG